MDVLATLVALLVGGLVMHLLDTLHERLRHLDRRMSTADADVYDTLRRYTDTRIQEVLDRLENPNG